MPAFRMDIRSKPIVVIPHWLIVATILAAGPAAAAASGGETSDTQTPVTADEQRRCRRTNRQHSGSTSPRSRPSRSVEGRASAQVTIIDVRTIEEYMWVGHTSMAWLVPVVEVDYTWDASKETVPAAAAAGFRGPGAEGGQARGYPHGHVPFRRPWSHGGQPSRQGRLQERLQHHRRYGGRHGQGSRERVPRPAAGEWLEEFGPAVDIRG